MTRLPAQRIAVTPDAVTGPGRWPTPYEGVDDPEDHDCDECNDLGGCPWCDQDWWRGNYSQLYQATDTLMAEVRAAYEALLRSKDPAQREIGKALRSAIGRAAVPRTRLPQ
jgi:hypothetical protein